jgi:histidyl-tRNA synthetase
VFEAVLRGEDMGSVAGGGRYDQLLGMFRKGNPLPVVGFALGIERIFDIVAKREAGQSKEPAVDVVLFSLGPGIAKEKLAVCRALWAAGIRTELDYSTSDNIGKKLKQLDVRGAHVAVFIGQEDIKAGTARVKYMATREQVSTKFEEIAQAIQKYLASLPKKGQVGAASTPTPAPPTSTK